MQEGAGKSMKRCVVPAGAKFGYGPFAAIKSEQEGVEAYVEADE